MSVGIIFALIAAISFGLWTVFHNQAASLVSPVLGATLVSLSALVVAIPFLLNEWTGNNINFSAKGIIFIGLAGITAFALDYFVLRAYSGGLPVSIGGPIIIGGSIAVATIIGFFLGEQITAIKIIAILLVIFGSALLASTTA